MSTVISRRPSATAAGLSTPVRLVRQPVFRARSVNVVLIGHTGQVGAALARRLNESNGQGAEHRLVLTEAFNRSRHQRWTGNGAEETGRNPATIERLAVRLRRAARPAVIVDCTADPDLPDLYPEWLERGIGVVTPNKHGLAGPIERYRRIQDAARLGRAPLAYSATVGAGLPILSTLRRLRQAGEKPVRIEAVLSGTLVHVLGRMADGLALSAALRDAAMLGYTEPDPLEDLSGIDVERKLTIMLREAGLEDVEITRQPLVPAAASAGAGPAGLESFDQEWQTSVSQARNDDQAWVYLASFDGNRAEAGPRQVDADSPFARLAGSGNLARIVLASDPETPLTVHGPGAGIEVTAAAVLADLRQAATVFD